MSNPITIIGGGVIGLSIGWRLARLGKQVRLFDKGPVGFEASRAAAGMITPASEVRFGETELLQFFLESLNQYPSFIKELERKTNLDTDFNTSGSLMIALDQDDEAELMRLYDYQKELGLPVSLLTPDQAVELEPLLSRQSSLAIQAHQECFLDNIKFIEALKEAFVSEGGELFENKEVRGVRLSDHKLDAIEVGNEIIPVSVLVLATGIQNKIKGLPSSFSLPIRPIKGQALNLKNNQSLKLTRAIRTIHRYPVYLVPRSDGRITLGATQEEMGLDQRVTAGALLDLIYGAWKILPSVYEMEVIETWSGFRPASFDNQPILGPTEIPNLFVAMGMYRHGILLTPIVSTLMAELIAKDKYSSYFKTFAAQRFLKNND